VILLQCPQEKRWLRFENPVQTVQALGVADVLPALRLIEELVRSRGLTAAGFIAYEASPAFDSSLRVLPETPVPLLDFGLYKSSEWLDDPMANRTEAPAIDWTPTVTPEEYAKALAEIKRHIGAGRTYQVNYSYRLRARFAGDPWLLFSRMAANSRDGYAAYLDLEDLVVCSASPELFFRLEDGTLTCRPMKGTAPRGRTLSEDRKNMERLRDSEKDRAENLMILDMVRNDLGRIAEIGSVEVPRLFDVERYPTVLQMTSTVTARTRASFTEILAALFPCASITGAPKASTMGIIADLETTPRGIYTGCIGWLAPEAGSVRAQFSVAIRTVTSRRSTCQAEYGVGGGILWESDPAAERRECETKTRVLLAPAVDFRLLEALLWTPSGYFLLERHLGRLAASAEYFDFILDNAALRRRLEDLAAGLSPEAHKVRVELSRDGSLAVTGAPLTASPRPAVMRVGLARDAVDSQDVFLCHKTSRRGVYDSALAGRGSLDDVILWNARGEVTESCTANVVADFEGQLVTPPVGRGLLAGTYRDYLLAEGLVTERVIPVEALGRARRLWLVNSVRRWMDAVREE
jgi:para-aminobenzoate synthetase/4-amino-4-deoxychorismate lyase